MENLIKLSALKLDQFVSSNTIKTKIIKAFQDLIIESKVSIISMRYHSFNFKDFAMSFILFYVILVCKGLVFKDIVF